MTPPPSGPTSPATTPAGAPQAVEASRSAPAAATFPGTRTELSPHVVRILEILPGLITWLLIVSLIVSSVGYPELVAWFVLSFDFYWLARGTVLAASVGVAYLRMRTVLAFDWTDRLRGLRDLPARERVLVARLDAVLQRVAELQRRGERLAARGGKRVAHLIETELNEVRRLQATRVDVVDPESIVQVALIPTYTEPFEKLYETLVALVAAEWPSERKIVAIITRETDHGGRENVARLREIFGDRFAHFFHILDPLDPGIVVGKSSAMAYGGRWLYRELVERGYDATRVLVTDLDSDYRVHRQYLAHLAYQFAVDPDRERRLYQPVPLFHNNLWEVPLPVRLVAIGSSHVHMWRSLNRERLISFSSYSVALQTVHDVGYWATDAIPEDSRFYWRSFFTYAGSFRAEPLFIPIYGDAVRAKSYPRTLAQQYTQIRRWAYGVTDIPFYVRQALSHREIPLRLRVRRLAFLWSDHINWAIAPFVLIFGSNLPLLLNPAFRSTTLGQNLPFYSSIMLTAALTALIVLAYIEDQLAPPVPRTWGRLGGLIKYLQWAAVPVVGILFTNLPALDAQTRLMTGRYLEYRVTEKA